MKTMSIFDQIEAEAEMASHYVNVSCTTHYGASMNVITSLN